MGLILGADWIINILLWCRNREFHSSSIDGLVSHIITILAELKAKEKIVKIGNRKYADCKEIGTMLN